MTDPVPKFRFAIQLQGAVVGWFTECSGMTVERQATPYSEGGVNDYVHQLPGRVSYSQVALKRGLADNALWDWFEKGLYDGKVERRNVTIILYNADLSEAKRWDMPEAYPVKWGGPDLNSETQELVIESIEIASGGNEKHVSIQRAVGEGEPGPTLAGVPAQVYQPDLPALAEKVYALLRHDLQIERERRGRTWR